MLRILPRPTKFTALPRNSQVRATLALAGVVYCPCLPCINRSGIEVSRDPSNRNAAILWSLLPRLWRANFAAQQSRKSLGRAAGRNFRPCERSSSRGFQFALQGLREGKFLRRERRRQYPWLAPPSPSARTRHCAAAASRPQVSTHRKRLEFPAPRLWKSQLEAVVEFRKAQCTIAIRRVDRFDHLPALRPSEVQPDGNPVPPVVIAADVVQVRQLCCSIRRPPAKSERPWLERAAARVPQVRGPRQPQPVHVAAHGERLVGAKNHFAEDVAIIHGIEKWKPRIHPRSGQHREEGAVRSVGRVAVSARIKVAGAEPGTHALNAFGLKTGFNRARARSLCERSPLPALQHSPAQQIESSRGSGRRHDVMPAVSPNRNAAVIRRTHRGGTVVCLEHVAIVVVKQPESAPFRVARSELGLLRDGHVSDRCIHPAPP